MSLQDHDKSAMHREVLRDLESLLAVWKFLIGQNESRAPRVEAEIFAVITELWGPRE